MRKYDSTQYGLQDTHLGFKGTNSLKVRGQIKIYHANSNQKRTRLGIKNMRPLDFKKTIVTTDKERHFIIVKASVHQ